MALILIETDNPTRLTVSCEQGSATIRTLAAGSAWNVAQAVLRQLTPQELHQLKVDRIGQIHREVSRAAAEAARSGYSLDDRFTVREAVPPESGDVLAGDGFADGIVTDGASG